MDFRMIEVKNISKDFDGLRAVDDITFSVGAGEILGFLGPNGAGKSTTMKMITGFLVSDTGSISVCGHDLAEDVLAAQKLIGYLPEGAPCYEDMTPRKFLNFIAEVRGFKGQEKGRRVDAVVKEMALQSVENQHIETLSKGFKRRVGLAQAILHDPEVLILDEPTDGLDPNQKHHVREMIRGLSKDKIVIISTHILEEVTAVCTRVMIIDDGRVVKDCSPQELEAESKYHHAVTVELDVSEALQAKFLAIDGVDRVEPDESGKRLTIFPSHGQSIVNSVNDVIHAEDLSISGLHVERGRLDDVFRSITTGGL
jgi:ABC-2 type transport system ATP-binding protein